MCVTLARHPPALSHSLNPTNVSPVCPVKSFTTYEDAAAFAAGKEPAPSADEPPRFYAVAIGRTPGVYTSWPKAQEAIVGWKGPKYKRFDTKAEAEAFVRTYSSANTNPAIAPLEISSDEDDEDEEEESDDDDIPDVAPPAKKAKVSGTLGLSGVPVVYTDGSSLGNGKLGATAGVGVFFGELDPRYTPNLLHDSPSKC